MSREEFIGKLEMVYVGDRNAFNDIVCAYDSVLSANEKAIEKINYYKYFISLTKSEEHMLNTLDNILQKGSEKE